MAKLMEEGVDPGDIGVIAPYRRQVLKLRERLAQKGWRQHIDVGTTEEFQGQEKKVIIVSIVRSLPEYVSMDSQYKLGFLFNSKRFNLGMRTENGIIPNPVGKIPSRERANYVDKSDPSLR